MVAWLDFLVAGSAGGRDRRKVSRIDLGTVRFGLQSAEAVTIVGAPHPKCGVLGSVEEPVNSPTILRGITVV
jgi:hypothetical protein